MFCTCKELPNFNVLETFKDGEEKEIMHPFFGGKTAFRAVYNPDGLTISAMKTPFGDLESKFVFTKEGCSVTKTAKNKAATFVEKWVR